MIFTLIYRQVISLKRLIKLFFAIFLGFLSMQNGLAQVPGKLRSTLNISGSSKSFESNGHIYYLAQSIGQSSVIGLSQNNKYFLRQGFIQPINSSITIVPPETLLATVYPNPFSENITVSFAEEESDMLYVTLTDINGKISYVMKFPPAREIKLNVESLAPSIYILRVNSTTKCFYSKMIKF